MRRLAVRAFALILGSSCFCSAQLTVRNPAHLYISEDRAQVIFNTACQVVAAQFHLRKGSKIDFPVIVVMGDSDERYTADMSKREFVIYLRHWDETQFATYSMGLAIHVLIPEALKAKIVSEILRRSGQKLPVSVNALRR